VGAPSEFPPTREGRNFEGEPAVERFEEVEVERAKREKEDDVGEAGFGEEGCFVAEDPRVNFLNFVKRPFVEGELEEEAEPFVARFEVGGGEVWGERETFEGTKEGGWDRSIGSIIAKLLISIPRFKNFATL